MAELGGYAAAGFSQGWNENRPIMTPGVSVPRVGAVMSATAGTATTSETTLNLNGVDPATVYQLMRQDLGGKLAVLS